MDGVPVSLDFLSKKTGTFYAPRLLKRGPDVGEMLKTVVEKQSGCASGDFMMININSCARNTGVDEKRDRDNGHALECRPVAQNLLDVVLIGFILVIWIVSCDNAIDSIRSKN